MKFSEKLSKLRKQNGMSQEELAEKLNVTRQTISKWELDQTTPDMDSLREIAKEFGVTIDELLNEEEIKKDDINNDPIRDINSDYDLVGGESGKNTSNYTESIKDNNGDKKIAFVIVLIIVICICIFFVFPLVATIMLQNKLWKSANEILDNPQTILNTVIDAGNEFFNVVNDSEILDEEDKISEEDNRLVENTINSSSSQQATQQTQQMEQTQSMYTQTQQMQEMVDDFEEQFQSTQQKIQESNQQMQIQQQEFNEKYQQTKQEIQDVSEKIQQQIENMKKN